MGEAVQKAAPARHDEVGSLGARTPGAGDGGQADGSVGGHGRQRASGVRPSHVRAKALAPTQAQRRSIRLAAAMRRASVSHRDLAAALEVSRGLVHHWCSPSFSHAPSASQWDAIEERAPRLALAFAEITAEELSGPPKVRLCEHATLRLAKRAADAVEDAYLEAVVDGIDDGERAEIARLATDLEERARRLRRAMEVNW